MPPSRAEALRAAAARLAEISDTPRLDAELLLAETLGLTRERLLVDGNAHVPAAFATLVARRLRHEPVAYIVGRRAFWTIELEVGPGVLIPRPDSESLLEAAVAVFGERGPGRVLDLGTGPGTLLLAALDQWPEATGLGVDVSEVALGYARRNGARLAPGRAEFRRGRWTDGVHERFDLVVCNPPYVERGAKLARQVAEWEPDVALYAGSEGLAEYRAVIPQLAEVLLPAGIVCLEVGAGQAEAVQVLAVEAGFTVALRKDLSGHDRCLVLRRK